MTDRGPSNEDRQLADGARDLGVTLGEAQRAALARYVELLYIWNRAAGLTTIARENAIRLHVLDSLAASPSVLEPPWARVARARVLQGPAQPRAGHWLALPPGSASALPPSWRCRAIEAQSRQATTDFLHFVH